MRRACLAAIVFWVSSALALASEDWTGLWRVKRALGDKVDGITHLYFSDSDKDKLIVYGDSFRPLEIRHSEIGEESFDIIVSMSIKHPLPVQMKMKRVGDRLEGEWTFSHFQMTAPVSGKAVGVRILDSNDWKPWESLKRSREKGIVDINRLLLDNAPTKTFEGFLEYWDEQEPDYYFFVQGWLYGNQLDDANPKEKRLRRVYETLRNSKNGKKLIKALPLMVEESLEESKALLRLEPKLYFVSSFGEARSLEHHYWTRIPDPGEYEACNCSILDLSELSVELNPVLFASSGDLSRVFLRKEIFSRILWQERARLKASREMDLLRQGLALRLALKAEGKEFPELEPAQIKQYLKLLLSPNSETVGAEPSEIAKGGLGASASYSVGYDFATTLLESRSAKELVGMMQPEVHKEWRAYTEKMATEGSGKAGAN